MRTDLARVATTWNPRSPEAYLHRWYPRYRHEMNGMLVLDTNGLDRVAIGDDVSDPNLWGRLAQGTGIVINYSLGFERSGSSLLTVNVKDRVVLGLGNAGDEALTLMVDDGGCIGLMARDGNHTLYLGRTEAQDSSGAQEPVLGLLIRDGQEVVHRVAVNIKP